MLIELMLALLGIIPQEGWASQYSYRVMEYTIKARVEDLQHVDHYNVQTADAYVAVVSCNRINETGYISINNSGWEKYVVTDCRGRNVAERWFEDNNIIVELDHFTALRHGVVEQGGVRVEMFPYSFKR